jgi:hypothetical protein
VGAVDKDVQTGDTNAAQDAPATPAVTGSQAAS